MKRNYTRPPANTCYYNGGELPPIGVFSGPELPTKSLITAEELNEPRKVRNGSTDE